MWSDQSDAPRADLLQASDDITVRLASSLEVELVHAERCRAVHAGETAVNLEDITMQCEAEWFRLGLKAEALMQTIRLGSRLTAIGQKQSLVKSAKGMVRYQPTRGSSLTTRPLTRKLIAKCPYDSRSTAECFRWCSPSTSP